MDLVNESKSNLAIAKLEETGMGTTAESRHRGTHTLCCA
jgi:hypothetical protein